MTNSKPPNPVCELFSFYWRTYGGFNEVVRSLYFRAAVALALVTSPGWMAKEWWDLPLTVLPNVLGFTIAGFAIFLSLGDEDFRRAIIGTDEGDSEPSPYLDVGISIFHFTVVQVIAIVVGAAAKMLNGTVFVIPSDALKDSAPGSLWALQCLVGWMIAIVGNVAFFYALGCALGVAALILQLMKSYDGSAK